MSHSTENQKTNWPLMIFVISYKRKIFPAAVAVFQHTMRLLRKVNQLKQSGTMWWQVGIVLAAGSQRWHILSCATTAKTTLSQTLNQKTEKHVINYRKNCHLCLLPNQEPCHCTSPIWAGFWTSSFNLLLLNWANLNELIKSLFDRDGPFNLGHKSQISWWANLKYKCCKSIQRNCTECIFSLVFICESANYSGCTLDKHLSGEALKALTKICQKTKFLARKSGRWTLKI